jgi:HPt (histidine-containing phosphotransfer) domain-containing protein
MSQDQTIKQADAAERVSPRLVPDGVGVDFDQSQFDELVAEIGREGTLETFAIFFEEASARLQRLRELSHAAERSGLAQEAHGLKGSAANFGLRHVSALAAMLEQQARTIASDDYEAALDGLEKSYAAAREQFAKLAA